MHDVIIIGAGTAGLMAARQLSCKFLVLESKKQIGYPLRCGEGIREKVFLKFFKHTNYPFIRNKVIGHVFMVNKVKRLM
jgi:flavin-dependent dehydrogenase